MLPLDVGRRMTIARRAARRAAHLAAAVAALSLAACGGAGSTSPTATPTAQPTATPAPTPTGTPTPTPLPTPVASADLVAVAQRVYMPAGATCESNSGGASPSAASYVNCPFTPALVQRIVAAEQAMLGNTGGGYNILCHCQAQPQAYNAGGATASGSGGSVTVQAVYGPDLVTFTLTIVTQNGQLLVNDITVQSTGCDHPQEIDASTC